VWEIQKDMYAGRAASPVEQASALAWGKEDQSSMCNVRARQRRGFSSLGSCARLGEMRASDEWHRSSGRACSLTSSGAMQGIRVQQAGQNGVEWSNVVRETGVHVQRTAWADKALWSRVARERGRRESEEK